MFIQICVSESVLPLKAQPVNTNVLTHKKDSRRSHLSLKSKMLTAALVHNSEILSHDYEIMCHIKTKNTNFGD